MAYQNRPPEQPPLEFPYIGKSKFIIYFLFYIYDTLGDVNQYERIDKIGQGTFG